MGVAWFLPMHRASGKVVRGVMSERWLPGTWLGSHATGLWAKLFWSEFLIFEFIWALGSRAAHSVFSYEVQNMTGSWPVSFNLVSGHFLSWAPQGGTHALTQTPRTATSNLIQFFGDKDVHSPSNTFAKTWRHLT